MTTDPKEQLLRKNVDAARVVATKDPTTKNRKALKEAQRELENHLKLKVQAEPMLESIPAMVDFLDSEGFKVGLSTAYEHRDNGKFKIGENGNISQSDALLYARKHLKLKSGLPADQDVGLQQSKLQKEVTRLDYDGRMKELKYRRELGELIEKSQVEIELAERATNLKNYLDTVARREAGKLCKILKGDPEKIPEAKAFMLEVNLRAFDNYSRPIKGMEDEK